jgi:hypothetical protein
MSDDFDRPSVCTPDPQIVPGVALHRSLVDAAASVAELRGLEGLLFDGDDHVRRDTSPEEADRLLGALNDLRLQLGWLCLDMGRHPCWPEDTRRAGLLKPLDARRSESADPTPSMSKVTPVGGGCW